jgi:hypothetical protein
MNALARTDYAAWSLPEAVVSELMRQGLYVFDEPVSPRSCAELLAEIRRDRRFDASLFLTEDAFAEALDAPEARGTRNLLDGFDGKLEFIERAPQLVEALWSLLGPDYRILDREVICVLPEAAIPQWVRRRIYASGESDLAPYVRSERRDIVYCAAGELRQDPYRDVWPAEVLTLDVNLHAVGEAEGLRLLEGSHRMGPLETSRSLQRTGPGGWRCRNGMKGEMRLDEYVFAGETGSAALRHGWTLWGDAAAQQERITLRYRFRRGAVREAGIDAVNAHLA